MTPYAVNSAGKFLSHNLRHHRQKRALITEQIHYHVPFKNETFHLILTPNDEFLAPGLKIEWRSGKSTQPVRNCHFTGSLKNHPTSSVAMSNCKGLVSSS